MTVCVTQNPSGLNQFIPPLQNAQQGKIGCKFSSGEQFLTSTGRKTTPFPKVTKTLNPTRWLLQNALAEAESRGDKFNARQFKSELDFMERTKQKNAPQATKESAEAYLFCESALTQPKQPKQPKQAPQEAG